LVANELDCKSAFLRNLSNVKGAMKQGYPTSRPNVWTGIPSVFNPEIQGAICPSIAGLAGNSSAVICISRSTGNALPSRSASTLARVLGFLHAAFIDL
jgi:hypothetical protein